MNAILLAAGIGERLRPLTHVIPKALLPVAGIPVIIRNLNLLRSCGVEEVVINLYSIPDAIKKEVSAFSGIKILFSEEETILGTAGGIKRAANLLGKKEFIVMNVDILADVDLNDLLRFHREKKGICTMVLRTDKNAALYGPIETDEQGKVKRFLGQPQTDEVLDTYMFTGIQVMHLDFLAGAPENSYSDISKDVYPESVHAEKEIFGYIFRDHWVDIGLPDNYLNANRYFLEKEGREVISSLKKKFGGAYIGPNVEIENGVEIASGSSIYSGCTIEDGVTIQNSVILHDTHICSGALITNSIIGPSTKISAGKHLNKAIGCTVKNELLVRFY